MGSVLTQGPRAADSEKKGRHEQIICGFDVVLCHGHDINMKDTLKAFPC